MPGILFWFCLLFVGYVLAGYPVLVALVARLRPPPQWPEPDPLPSVTLLIAAWNEEAVLARRLENALALDYPSDRLQILVASDGSDDRTPEIARAFAERGVELSHSPERRGKMDALAHAMTAARGEIVVFSDANNAYGADCLRRLVAPFSDPKVGVVSGAKQVAEDGRPLSAMERIYWRYESALKDAETRLGACVAAAGEILALRRRLFEPPPPGIVNDDFFLVMRALKRGWRSVSVSTAVSTEKVSLDAAGERERRARINAGRLQALASAPRLLSWRRPVVAWQVFSHKFSRVFLAPAFLVAFVASAWAAAFPPEPGPWALARLAPPWNWAAFLAQAAFWGLALCGPLFKGRSRLLYLPAYLLNANLAAFAGIRRFLSGRQSVLWDKVRRED